MFTSSDALLVLIAALCGSLGYFVATRKAARYIPRPRRVFDAHRRAAADVRSHADFAPQPTPRQVRHTDDASGLVLPTTPCPPPLEEHVRRILNLALRIMRDPDVNCEPSPTYFKGDKKFKFTSKLPGLVGYKLFLMQPEIKEDTAPEDGKHSWHMHDPADHPSWLPVGVCFDSGLDAAWGEWDMRVHPDPAAQSPRAAAKRAEFILLSDKVSE